MSLYSTFVVVIAFLGMPAFAEQSPPTCQDLAQRGFPTEIVLQGNSQLFVDDFFTNNDVNLRKYALRFIDEPTILQILNPASNGLDLIVGNLLGFDLTTLRLNTAMTAIKNTLPQPAANASKDKWIAYYIGGIRIDAVMGVTDIMGCQGVRYQLSRQKLLLQLPSAAVCALPTPPAALDAHFRRIVKGQTNASDRYSELLILYGAIQNGAQKALAQVSYLGRGGFSFNVGFTCGIHANTVIKFTMEILDQCAKKKFRYYMVADLVAFEPDHEFNGIVEIPSERTRTFPQQLAKRREQTAFGRQTGKLMFWDGKVDTFGWSLAGTPTAEMLHQYNNGDFSQAAIIATLDAMTPGSNDVTSWLGQPPIPPIVGPIAAVACDTVPKQGSPTVMPGFGAVSAKYQKAQLILIPAKYVEGGK